MQGPRPTAHHLARQFAWSRDSAKHTPHDSGTENSPTPAVCTRRPLCTAAVYLGHRTQHAHRHARAQGTTWQHRREKKHFPRKAWQTYTSHDSTHGHSPCSQTRGRWHRRLTACCPTCFHSPSRSCRPDLRRAIAALDHPRQEPKCHPLPQLSRRISNRRWS